MQQAHVTKEVAIRSIAGEVLQTCTCSMQVKKHAFSLGTRP
jgi:hypothetical protein